MEGNNALATARANFEADMNKGTVTEKTDTPVEKTPEPEKKTVDLKELGKFVFEGKEVTYDDLKKSYMLQSDYTRKTQEIANERKYTENLSYDLENLKNSPNLIAKFKEIYPEKYHSLGDKIAAMARGKTLEEGDTTQRIDHERIDPKVIDEITAIKQRLDMSDRQKASIVLDKIVGSLEPKYAMANSEVVQAKAQFIMEQTGQFLPLKEWENLFKEDHEYNLQKSTKYFKSIMDKQKQANSQAKDSAPGGMAVGKATPKTFEEATQLMMRDLASKK